MRIVYITEHLPYTHGEAFLLPEITTLQSRGHELMILPVRSPAQVFHEDAEALLQYTHAISLKSPRLWAGAACEAMAHPAAMRRLLGIAGRSRMRQMQRDNVKTIMKGAYLARWVHRWHAEHIHAHWANYPATMAMAISHLTGVPWSMTAHRYDIVADNLLAEKIAGAGFVRFISDSGMALARQTLHAELPSNCTRIHMGVELPPLASGGGSKPVMLCPASFVPVKGHRYLIEAIALLARDGNLVELWLAGCGELESAIRAQLEELGMGAHVRMLGQLSHAQLLHLYQTQQVAGVVLPSLDLGNCLHEGIPVSLIEAMSYGIPVIGTQTGGIPELLGGGAGLLVPPGDARALASAIRQVCTISDEMGQLGLQGRRRIEEEYAVETVVSQLEARFKASLR